jgi:hypothetical protein
MEYIPVVFNSAAFGLLVVLPDVPSATYPTVYILIPNPDKAIAKQQYSHISSIKGLPIRYVELRNPIGKSNAIITKGRKLLNRNSRFPCFFISSM